MRAAGSEVSALSAYFLVGPTAAGKTAVAERIAEQGDWEILSADSMLVYAGMDIGTAKPAARRNGAPFYHGLDLRTPDRTFSVWDYRAYALRSLREIADRGHRALVAGGTGLYVKSLTDRFDRGTAPDPAVRAEWTARLEEEGVPALQEALRAMRPDLYAALADKRNPRRLIRALELAAAGAQAPDSRPKGKRASAPLAGLSVAREALQSRIESRVRAMYAGGLVEEVRDLLRLYGRLSSTALQAIGYAEAADFLEGRCSREEAMASTVRRTRRLAKRQMTWFRHQADVRWVRVGTETATEATALKVLGHWEKHGPTAIQC